MTMTTDSLLEVRDLAVTFSIGRQQRCILSGISFSLDQQSTTGIVGESGSGKTVLALSLLGLIGRPPLHSMTGVIRYRVRDLTALSGRAMRAIRGKEIAFVFQEPMTALNPVMSIGSQIVETIRAHERISRRAAWQRGIELLHEVRIPSPALRMKSFPHQLSGGMRQRAMIAMALSCSPRLLIADEPTTALDVTIQAQILELLRDLQHRRRMSILFITHDLGVIGEIADQVVVMRDGVVVEQGRCQVLFQEPRHEYTRMLLGLHRRRAHAGA
jgi:ABC-type dipeptide/oligopeptide/nickel transport system ATPase component